MVSQEPGLHHKTAADHGAGVVGPVRFTPPPCPIDDLPDVDAVVISHDHYDHLDSDTLGKLNAKQNGELRFFCGLGVKAVLTGLGV